LVVGLGDDIDVSIGQAFVRPDQRGVDVHDLALAIFAATRTCAVGSKILRKRSNRSVG
jgi:hypothetical protein